MWYLGIFLEYPMPNWFKLCLLLALPVLLHDTSATATVVDNNQRSIEDACDPALLLELTFEDGELDS